MSTTETVGRPLSGNPTALVPVPDPVVKAEEKDDGREYVVLRQLPAVAAAGGAPTAFSWQFVANVEATSAQQAVRKAAETPGTSFLDPEGSVTLVAIPTRSFSPVTVTVKTTTTVVLS